MNGIDPQQFGQLIEAVARLSAQVDHMAAEFDKITNDLSRGKGIIVGITLAAGGIGAGATHLLEKIFK